MGVETGTHVLRDQGEGGWRERDSIQQLWETEKVGKTDV